MRGADKRANQSGASRRGQQLCSAAAAASSLQSCTAPPSPRLLRSVNSFQRTAPVKVCLDARSNMLACTEMITMCLQSAKQKHLRAQQQQQQQQQPPPLHSTGQGLSIFHDIFRRADKTVSKQYTTCPVMNNLSQCMLVVSPHSFTCYYA
ncbi:hypothetical protein INR49_014026 [Caranx melampygus]|nr:hypothetical protein INR49_014026 [Caranx melampygus]